MTTTEILTGLKGQQIEAIYKDTLTGAVTVKLRYGTSFVISVKPVYHGGHNGSLALIVESMDPRGTHGMKQEHDELLVPTTP